MTARRGVLRLLLAAPVAGWALTGGTALADPVPGQDEVDAARAAAAAAEAEATRLQAELTTRQAALDDATTRLSVAAEDYDEARALLATRTADAAAAQSAADAARADRDAAQLAVGRLASQRYRGVVGDLGPVAGVLGATSTQDLLDRAATLDHLAGQRDEVLRRAERTRAAAQDTAAQADRARTAQQQATDTTERTRAAAAQASDAAAALVADSARRTAETVARLAQLRSTSVELEQRRQDGLAAEQRARDEAAARAAAEAAAADDAAPAGTAGPALRVAAGPTAGADTAVAWALAQRGKPYLWAADGPDSFDCSGLTLRAWGAAGVSLPHSSRLQYSGQAKVALADLQAGDLVFYATDTSNPASVHHVGMVVSPGVMVEAPHTGADVRTSSIYRRGLLPHGTRPA